MKDKSIEEVLKDLGFRWLDKKELIEKITQLQEETKEKDRLISTLKEDIKDLVKEVNFLKRHGGESVVDDQD